MCRKIGTKEVLIRVVYAGFGEWDSFEREGKYAEMLGLNPSFPYVLGSEGSGTIVAQGENISDVNLGDLVYAPAFQISRG